MLPKGLTTVDLAPLLLIGWQMVLPLTELRVVSALVLVVAAVMVARLVAREIRPRARRVLILGDGPMAGKLLEEIAAARPSRYAVVGIVDDAAPEPGSGAAQRWLGAYDRLDEIVEQVRPECIALAAVDRRTRLPMHSLLQFRVRGILVEDAVEFYERLTGKMAIEALRPSALVMAKGFRNHGPAETTARITSMGVAAIGLALMAPLLILLAFVIRLDSRGPILFVQQRAGRDGRPFGLLKFRTMHPCAEPHSEWVMDNLHRITRLGRWLRRFRLDELPQLVNVLRGEMNIIGPRPHPTSNHAVFMERIAYYGLRSSVRPGVTGWAQVRYGYANNLDEETEKMRYDLFYIKNRSLWLDARILLETIGIMIFGTGASAVRRPSPTRSELVPTPSLRRSTEVSYIPLTVARTVPGPPGQA